MCDWSRFWRPAVWVIVVMLTGLLFVFFDGGAKMSLAEEEVVNEQEDEVEQLEELAAAKKSFAIELFPKIVEDENLFVSPYSIHAALSLAYLGAGGQTREELIQALALTDLDEVLVKKQSLRLENQLEQLSDETEVSIANALFLRKSIDFLESYKLVGKNYFDAEISQLPLTGETINDWVAEKTNDLISRVISPEPIPQEIIAYLGNAI